MLMNHDQLCYFDVFVMVWMYLHFHYLLCIQDQDFSIYLSIVFLALLYVHSFIYNFVNFATKRGQYILFGFFYIYT